MAEPNPPLRISVVGAGEASVDEAAQAEAVGRAIALAGGLVITGGLGGVMSAASRGCSEAGGVAVGILPGIHAAEANPWVRIPIASGLGEARNALVVRAADAVVAVGGSWGTLSEIALARKMGIPVVLLGSPPVDLPLRRMETPQEAAAWALQAALERRGLGPGEGT
jgi:uncharacterized protein (TIGR00725 family)